jgi:threonine/homoserine/homoserine lactone efflux protein
MSFITFLIAAVVLAVTPGPGIAYVVARTAAGGRAEGLASCLGTTMGGLCHVVAAALGLSLLIAQSALLFSLVKYVGAAYLLYLGVRMLMRREDHAPAEAVASRGARRAWRDGILVEALNVKTALFFLAFLPQFTTPTQPLVPQLILLGSVCVVLNTLADVSAVFAAARLLQSNAARAARARMLTRTSGVVMVSLGIYLALARRAAAHA